MIIEVLILHISLTAFPAYLRLSFAIGLMRQLATVRVWQCNGIGAFPKM